MLYDTFLLNLHVHKLLNGMTNAFPFRSVKVGLTISLDYWWTVRGLEEVSSLGIYSPYTMF